MKITFILFSALLYTTGLTAQVKKASEQTQTTVTPTNAPEITFTKDVHDFGTINKGDNGTYEFTFKNTGKQPLIISNAQGSCGCTVPQWPKEPIAPGASSKIKVTYDTKRVGAFTKTVTISSNGVTSSKVITIKGVVNDIPAEETFPANKPSLGSPLENK